MSDGPIGQALDEIKRNGGDVDIDRIARRYGVDVRILKQRISRARTFAKAIEANRGSNQVGQQHQPQSPPRRGSGEKRRTQLRFLINGLVIKFYRQEFYRGELKLHTRRGWEQCTCGRDLVTHAVPVVSDARCPSLLCECGAAYEAEPAK